MKSKISKIHNAKFLLTTARSLAAVTLLLQLWGPPVLAGETEAGVLPSSESPRVVAQVGDREITSSELEQELARRSGGAPGAFATVEERRLVLEEMVARELLVVAAAAAGYGEDPSVLRAFEDLMVQKFRQDRLDPALSEVEITAEEIEQFYEQNLEIYRLPARRRAALVKLPARPEDSRQQAEELRARVSELGTETLDFGPLAAEVSHDRATRYRGGDMGYLAPEMTYRWPTEVVAAAWELERVGEVSEVIEVDGFLWLVRLSEAEGTVYRSRSEVEATIRHELHRRKSRELREQQLAELRTLTTVRISEDALRSVEPPPEMKPPSLPKP